MRWYKLNDDHSVELLQTYPMGEDMNKDRHVDFTTLGDVKISTVFLQLDHSWGREGETPILFETMIFGGEHDNYMWRYTTWGEAKAGHDRIVECIKNNINPND
jgi:hypothetical protein